MDKLRVAILGCGNITESIHLPMLAAHERVRVVMLVDTALSRAERLAQQFKVEEVSSDYQKALGKIDVAVVALPNDLHAPVSIDLLRNGTHVLVEKPMGLSPAECDRMTVTAAEHKRVLAVGMVRRFYDSSQFVKRLLDFGVLGRIVSFEAREGNISRYSLASDYSLRRDLAGGGVLITVGIHLVDCLLWWFGDFPKVEYADDAVGGVEGDCELRLQTESGISGRVELSWTRNLPNLCRIVGEKGTIEFGTGPYAPPLSIQLLDQPAKLQGTVQRKAPPDPTYRELYRREFDDFFDAIQTGRPPLVTGQEGRRSVELIRRCYDTRRLLDLPWIARRPAVAAKTDLRQGELHAK